MTDQEANVWRFILANRNATADEIATACKVPLDYVEGLLGRIASLNWRQPVSTLDTQVGGSHYRDMSIQPWQAMEAWLTPEEYRGYHKGVAVAYLARERQKGGLADIEKAIHHLQRLVEVERERSTPTD